MRPSILLIIATLFHSSFSLPVAFPTPAPGAKLAEKRQIGVSELASSSLSGDQASAFLSQAKAESASFATATTSATSVSSAATGSSGIINDGSLGVQLGASGFGAVVVSGNLTGTEENNSGAAAVSIDSSSSVTTTTSVAASSTSVGSTTTTTTTKGSKTTTTKGKTTTTTDGTTTTTTTTKGTTTTTANNTTTTTTSANNTTTTTTTTTTTSASSSTSSSTSSSSNSTDLLVLQFAHVLEQLETDFYAQAIKKFPVSEMVKAGLSQNQANIIFQTISTQQSDEASHVKILEDTIKALGSTPFTGCSFNFDSVLKNPATFVAAAREIELVGVSAYAGAANLISNPDILVAAASILPIEARHQTLLNLFSGGDALPQSFDIALAPQSVLALAGGFLKGCSANDLGLTSNQVLSVFNAKNKSSSLVKAGDTLAFESSAFNSQTNATGLFCHQLIGGNTEAVVKPVSSCDIAANVDGPVMIFVANTKTPLPFNSQGLTLQASSAIVAGPAVLFVDNSKNDFQKLFDIKGQGIQQIAAGRARRDMTKRGLIVDLDQGEIEEREIVDGLVRINSKRGYQSEGAMILGWNKA